MTDRRGPSGPIASFQRTVTVSSLTDIDPGQSILINAPVAGIIAGLAVIANRLSAEQNPQLVINAVSSVNGAVMLVITNTTALAQPLGSDREVLLTFFK